ncbi:unnamed protein product, partial [marine sediment metagenome]
QVHPKGMYINVAGSSTTNAGLTSTVIKDQLTGEWTFDAGAIPLMHKGILAIDEISGLQDPQALQECLEQMTVTIIKATIQAKLLAETTILAACNPKTGRFDPFQNIYDQIDMPPQLVNRFDLIFPFKDIRNVEKDTIIAESILGRHTGKKKDKESKIDPELVKKWIIMGQKFKPTLPPEVAKYMKKRYVEIRNKKRDTTDQNDDAYQPVPITPRQLQAMIRCSQAYSKLKLQGKVSKERARFAVDLVIGSLELIGLDPETGEIDIQKIEGSLVASKREK